MNLLQIMHSESSDSQDIYRDRLATSVYYQNELKLHLLFKEIICNYTLMASQNNIKRIWDDTL